ncbi:hypothetical protein PACTADRAFT_49635 [Pachysolen tannophilus NRRL Y-2460]|uniref:Cell differentiation protein rcd1 n=1 Tax=Pachysolen tannophilus NRRL Y-2460 TaxID=669874 RepID=A0A1E4TX03_PACTA|nr:hypothetical protein PACTADRAFT_49635 [Pachysolen tannophilus NRRL Y-2460]
MYRPMYNDAQLQAAQLAQQRQQQFTLQQQQAAAAQAAQQQQQQQQQQFNNIGNINLRSMPQPQQAAIAQVSTPSGLKPTQQTAIPQPNQQAQINTVPQLQTPLSQQGPQVQQLQPAANGTGTINALNDEKVYPHIVELVYGTSAAKEQALLELGKKRELYDDLALVLWNSFGVMTSLLEEIIAVYPLLSPPQLSPNASNRICNALALLQCVASHPETRNSFLNAHIPLFLYPFLNTTSKQRSFEYLRLTSLGVIGALVKNDTPEVISFLLTTEIIPLCLRIMESSSELSKTVAIFIVQKILVDDSGLNYVCATYERFNAVATVLKLMVDQLVHQQTIRLLKHVVRCYLRLSDNADARKALRECLPEPLKDATFSMALRDDTATKRCLAQLLVNISESN